MKVVEDTTELTQLLSVPTRVGEPLPSMALGLARTGRELTWHTKPATFSGPNDNLLEIKDLLNTYLDLDGKDPSANGTEQEPADPPKAGS